MTAPEILQPLGRTRIMGVLNVTPDSFSDGGKWFETRTAIDHGLALVESGADLVDIGGESTRPGSVRVPEDEELRRVVPVTRELAAQRVTISVDTMRASVARAALDAGATIINDVSAGQSDGGMLELAAEYEAPIVLMHWRGYLSQAEASFHYDDVVGEVTTELLERVAAAEALGIRRENIILDPGPGFSKNGHHNWDLLRGLDELLALPFPMLVAVSRKRFLATLVSPEDPGAASIADRDAATAALTMYAAQAGAWAVRVHEARASRIAVDVATELAKGQA